MQRADFSDQDMTAQWRKPQVINFSKECCPNAMRRRQAVDVCRPQARRFNPAGFSLVFSARRGELVLMMRVSSRHPSTRQVWRTETPIAVLSVFGCEAESSS
jgi:hypothetical protein